MSERYGIKAWDGLWDESGSRLVSLSNVTFP